MVVMNKAIAEHLFDTLGEAWCSLEHAKEVYGSIKEDNKTKDLYEMQEKLIAFSAELSEYIEE